MYVGCGMKKIYLEVGKIVGTQGLKGEVRIEPWCDGPDFITGLKRLFSKNGDELKIKSARVNKNITVVHFEGINTIEQAEAHRGEVLYLKRDDVQLPYGVNFVQDIIGLKAIDEQSGEEYGKITDIISTGANDVYQITKNGKNYLIPKIDDVVSEINIDDGFVKINTQILGGLFEDED